MDDRAKELVKNDIAHFIHPMTNLRDHAQVGPRIFVKGEGALLYDVEGKEYIDGLACLWNVTLGHGRRELAEAAAQQMTTLAFSPVFGGLSHEPGINLATRLAGLAPGDINHFCFSSGGADANETAFKLARFYFQSKGENERYKVISRRFGYHGITLATMSATGMPAYQNGFGPLVPGFSHIAPPYCYRCEFGLTYPECKLACADALEEAILAEGPQTVAAFIGEPVQGAGGIIVPPEGYWQRIREICDKYGVLLIADEVITGFGRTGKYWGVQNWDLRPDMMTMAKAITSGYQPLGAVGVSDWIWDQLLVAPPEMSFMHGYTYSGHPTCCAVALVTLDIIEREKIPEQAKRKGDLLLKKLAELKELDFVGEVRGLGLLAGIELVKNKQTRERFSLPMKAQAEVLKEASSRGLICRPTPNCLALAPALVITDEQIERLVKILSESIQAAKPRLMEL
jgi:putrescine---pyruvate transaminase